MDSIEKLTALFMQFPGIGPRQAARFSRFLLTRSTAYRRKLTGLIERLGESVSSCGDCRRFFARKSASHHLCDVCADPHRDASLLMVVEKEADLDIVERSGTYRGGYFVLGGVLPILEKEPKKKVRAEELTRCVRNKRDSRSLREIIIALSLTTEGEHTAAYLENLLRPLVAGSEVCLSTLGRGLSTGLEIEYSDAETMRYALERRVALPPRELPHAKVLKKEEGVGVT